jgi:hypothetical protein
MKKNGQSRETGSIAYTKRRKTKQKHNTICDGHHHKQTNTNNVNKKWSLLQRIGGKGEPNFVFYAELRTSRHINRATQKTKQMNNTDPTKKPVITIHYTRYALLH